MQGKNVQKVQTHSCRLKPGH